MSDFDYVKLSSPDVHETYSFEELLGDMTDMEDEYVPFVGCFYGDPGTRKTTQAMELLQRITEPDKKIIYVYTGKGFVSLKNFPHLMKRVKAIPFKSYAQIDTLQQILSNPVIRDKMKIGAVIFDEYNRMQDIDTDRLTKGRAKRINAENRRDKNGSIVYKDPDTPEWPDFNTTKLRVINLMNTVLSIKDVHTVFVCHTRIGNKSKKVEPDFPNATSSAFMSMVHSLYLCKKTEEIATGLTHYQIEFDGEANTSSKNRIGGMPQNAESNEAVKLIADAFIKWNTPRETIQSGETAAPVAPQESLEKISSDDLPLAEEKDTDFLNELGI